MCSLQYNIAVVTIEPQFDLPLVKLHDVPVCYSMLCRPVIAVARNFKSKTLLVRCGEMTRERSELDCDELLVCTCPVSKVNRLSISRKSIVKTGLFKYTVNSVSCYRW